MEYETIKQNFYNLFEKYNDFITLLETEQSDGLAILCFSHRILDEYFNYGFSGDIVLTDEEFKEFVKLYNEDCNDEKMPKDWFINQEEIKELLESNQDKVLQWW